MHDQQPDRVGIRRGIYLLPNLFTVGVLFSGFYAIVAATKHKFDVAAIAIFIGMLLDSLDGRIARLTGTQSDFGAQFDSLSDMVCFGLTPALVLYSWSLNILGKPGWLAAFIYAVCTALRLARFNAQAQQTDKRYFRGLSTTAAAGVVAGLVWASAQYNIDGRKISILIMIITIALGLLKVSTIRYRSFKDLDLRGKVPFVTILIIILLFVLISFDPPDVFLAIFSAYALSGPVNTAWKWYQQRRKKKRPSKSSDQ